ncbi:MAG: ABC transporter ATP-binding protein [Desulfobacterales bacterium]
MLTVDGLTKFFASNRVLDGFDLRVPRRGFTILVGPSGCGKSTLFDVLTGIVPPDSGEIHWLGRPVSGLERIAAYMQQRDLLLPWLTLMENALLPARIGRLEGGVSQAEALFVRMGLSGFEDHLPAMVSGGMRQRCALVRTLMFNRELVLLDEPLSALDAITRRHLHGLLLMLQTEFDRTLLMITHDIEEALLLGDEVLLLGPSPLRVVERLMPPPGKPRSSSNPTLVDLKAKALELLAGENGR